MENIALFFHLLGAFLLIAGIVLAGVAFASARSRHEPTQIALLLSLARVAVLLVAVGAVLLLGFGLWLVHLGGFGYGAAWVDASIALYAAALALGGLGGRRPRKARVLALKLADDGAPVSDELRALLDDRLSTAANHISALMILAIFALMVFKP